MKRVMVFGAGEGGRRALTHLKGKAEVVCVLDNDTKKHGSDLNGVPICAPARATEADVDQVLIASIHSVAIFDQLLGMGVDVRKIDVLEHEFLQDFATFPKGIRNLIVVVVLGLLVLLGWGWVR